MQKYILYIILNQKFKIEFFLRFYSSLQNMFNLTVWKCNLGD